MKSRLFRKKFKTVTPLTEDIKVPPMIYVANKSEDNYLGDILDDFYKLKTDPQHTVDEPIFISADHGDGLTDLYEAIQ